MTIVSGFWNNCVLVLRKKREAGAAKYLWYSSEKGYCSLCSVLQNG
jgi:hypothetical protein